MRKMVPSAPASKGIRRPPWVTKDERVMYIEEMDNDHIANCIQRIEKSIEKGKPWRAEFLPLFQAERDLRQAEGRW